jgi:hypothetical protein
MRAVVNIFVFFVAVALMATVIGMFAPEPHIPIVTTKVTWFQEHGDDFDVIFLGSSRTYRQVIPEKFDELMAAAGHAVRTFNLGIDGMRPPEDTYVLEHAVRRRTKPLRWVFVECSPLRLTMRPEDRGTLRATYWHDAKRTATLFRRAFLADEKRRKWRDRLNQIARYWPDFEDHAEYFIHNATRIGRGYAAFENLAFKGGPPQVEVWNLGKRLDGYRPSEHSEHMPPAELAIYEQQIATMRATPPRVDYGDPVSQAELREKQRIIEKAGGKMILLMPPYTATRFFHPKLGGDHAPLLLDFSSLEKYPALYAPENHSDSGHLNRAGSEIYTREIARLLLEHLD